MDGIAFSTMLNLLGTKTGIRDTKSRESVSTEERLLAILIYLVTGRNYEDFKFSTIIFLKLPKQLIPETCLEL